jgi:melibiose permease/lactose/raffinose/galactose permease
MILMICIANTTEYNDYKFGKRCEGVIFSTRAFLCKLGGAVNTLVVMLFYIVIGINKDTNKIASLEQDANLGKITSDQKLSTIKGIINGVSQLKINSLLLLICIVSIICFTAAYFIYKKKYFITEEYFDEITEKIRERNEAAEEAGNVSAQENLSNKITESENTPVGD